MVTDFTDLFFYRHSQVMANHKLSRHYNQERKALLAECTGKNYHLLTSKLSISCINVQVRDCKREVTSCWSTDVKIVNLVHSTIMLVLFCYSL